MRLDIKSIDEYIRLYPQDTQIILKKIYEIAKHELPQAEEAMRYGMPTFRLDNQNLFHFAAYKNHIGFYPTPSIITKFADQLKEYKTSKGAIQFPIKDTIPYSLIKEMIKSRIVDRSNSY